MEVNNNNNNNQQQWTKSVSNGCFSGQTTTFTTLTDIPNNSRLLGHGENFACLSVCNTASGANAIEGMGMYSFTDINMSEEDFDEDTGSYDDLDCTSKDSEEECNQDSKVLKVLEFARIVSDFPPTREQAAAPNSPASCGNYFEGCKGGSILLDTERGSVPMTVDSCRENGTTQSSSKNLVPDNLVLTSKESISVSASIIRQETTAASQNSILKRSENMEISLITSSEQSCEDQPSVVTFPNSNSSSVAPQTSTVSSCPAVALESEEPVKGIREECIKNSLLPSSWESSFCSDFPRPVINPSDDVWIPWKASAEWGRNQPHQTLLVPSTEYTNQQIFKWTQQEALLERGSSSEFASNSPQRIETAESLSSRERRCSSGYSSEVPSEIRNVPYSIGRKGVRRPVESSLQRNVFQHHPKDITHGASLAMSHYQSNYPLNCEQWYNLPVNSIPYHPNTLSSRSLMNPDALPCSGLPNDISYHPNFLARNYSNYSVFSQFHHCPKQHCDLKEPITYEMFVESLPENVSPSDVFCMVPGRLGMPNQGKKHQVLVGEILRRVLAPESLNISLLGPILRKAKSKNGSKYLRQKLNQIGVELPQGRRKTAQCTLFTSLTESEAIQLADDFSKLNESSFPAKSLAANFICEKTESIPQSSESYEDTIKLLDGFAALLTTKSQTCNNGDKTSVNDPTSQQLYNFDTLTHGFGSKAILSSLNTFRTYITRMLEISKLDKN